MYHKSTPRHKGGSLMNLADKLIELRKKAGLSQEELAEKMNVTRQSVSKWESAQSVPDLEKIIKLSELYNVSTDYLLKDDIKNSSQPSNSQQNNDNRETNNNDVKNERKAKAVSIDDANGFIEAKIKTSSLIAFATFLCIISPIGLLICCFFAAANNITSDINIVAIGLPILLIIVAIAVGIFIYAGSLTSKYSYIEKEILNVPSEILNKANEFKENYHSKYTALNIVGVCMCILSAIPIFAFTRVLETRDVGEYMILVTALLLLIIGIAVAIIIKNNIIWLTYDKLLQQGDYTADQKRTQKFSSLYWSAISAIYLLVSFITTAWSYTWIIWVVAPFLFNIFKHLLIKNNKNE